jgi:hypothetical protein
MWQRERDLLIAQTMAFVQSVTGKPMVAVGRPEARPLSVLPSQPVAVEHPANVLPPARLSSAGHSDMRDEIHSRVAAFRARQQAFDRDRNEYCNAMMAKARASTEQVDKAQGKQPPKR